MRITTSLIWLTCDRDVSVSLPLLNHRQNFLWRGHETFCHTLWSTEGSRWKFKVHTLYTAGAYSVQYKWACNCQILLVFLVGAGCGGLHHTVLQQEGTRRYGQV